MNVANMRVGARLSVGYGLVLALLAAILVLGIVRMAQIEERLERIVSENVYKMDLANEMANAVHVVARVTRTVILLDDDAAMNAEARKIEQARAAYDKAAAALAQMAVTGQGQQLRDAMRAGQASARPLNQKVLELAREKQNEEAIQLLVREAAPATERWQRALDDYVAYQKDANDRDAAAARSAYESARSTMLMLGALALLVGIAAAVVITRSLLKQLGGEPSYAAEVAGHIARGDLTVPIDLKRGDNGSLLHAMKNMRDQLAQLVGQVKTGSETIASASHQIATGNLDLSSRTEEQASSLEETASSMEELTSTVKQNADNARQANTLAVSASGVAAKGGEVVDQVVATMGSINESARKIVDIIGVIDGIAFQTNILALNAAVEAARAGEQGRGFAVVASEVRNLAQRSAAAAKEIKSLIGDSVEKVEAGTRLVDQAGATMEEVVGSVKRVTDIISEIAAASDEQREGIEQVNQAITQMDQVTQQNAALVEEAAAAADALQEQAARLSEVVSVFKLAGASGYDAPARLQQPALAAAKTGAPKSPARAASSPARAVTHAKSAAAPARKAPAPVVNANDWEEF